MLVYQKRERLEINYLKRTTYNEWPRPSSIPMNRVLYMREEIHPKVANLIHKGQGSENTANLMTDLGLSRDDSTTPWS